VIGVVIGLGYKAALVPFHFWAPDAYEGAPVSIAAYMSVMPKIGAIFALAQVVRDLPTGTDWPLVIAVVSVLTMTYGYLAALVQNSVVRLLAYSSVAQAGYFLLGVVAVGTSPLAFASLIVFAAAYAAMNLGAFAVVMSVGRTLDTFSGIGNKKVLMGIAMVVFLLSLAGVPPLSGFVGKFLLFGAAMDTGFIWLAVAAILNSVLSLAVYLRIVVPMYRQRENGTEPVQTTRPKAGSLIALVWMSTAKPLFKHGVEGAEGYYGIGLSNPVSVRPHVYYNSGRVKERFANILNIGLSGGASYAPRAGTILRV